MTMKSCSFAHSSRVDPAPVHKKLTGKFNYATGIVSKRERSVMLFANIIVVNRLASVLFFKQKSVLRQVKGDSLDAFPS